MSRLLDNYDTLLLDLDGTVYHGAQAVPGAAATIKTAHDAGVTIRFITNNASRGPEEVAAHLTEIGVTAHPDEVSTSSQAAAAVLASKIDANAEVLVVGSPALMRELDRFTLVREASDNTVAVVQGLSMDTSWRDLAEASVAIRAGALWVACNVDATLPTERGPLPGNGSLVAALKTATGAEPLIAGKPATPLFVEAMRSANATEALVVGDRLDTDIAGAVASGLDSLFVLTGASTPAELLSADDSMRPTYIAADLTGIAVDVTDQRGWHVENNRVSGTGDPVALLRALYSAPPGNLIAIDDAADVALTHLDLPHEVA